MIKTINKLRADKKQTDANAAPTTKECPYCYTTIDARATKCPNCTADLNQ